MTPSPRHDSEPNAQPQDDPVSHAEHVAVAFQDRDPGTLSPGEQELLTALNGLIDHAQWQEGRFREQQYDTALAENDLFDAERIENKTGLLNRVSFEKDFVKFVEGARRTGQSVGMIVVDGNNMKGINTRYGTAVGTQAIETYVEALRSTLRNTDLIYRWGGDEFVVALDGGRYLVSEDDGSAKAFEEDTMEFEQRTNNYLAGTDLAREIDDLSVTMVACAPKLGEDSETFFNRAARINSEHKPGARQMVQEQGDV